MPGGCSLSDDRRFLTAPLPLTVPALSLGNFCEIPDTVGPPPDPARNDEWLLVVTRPPHPKTGLWTCVLVHDRPHMGNPWLETEVHTDCPHRDTNLMWQLQNLQTSAREVANRSKHRTLDFPMSAVV